MEIMLWPMMHITLAKHSPKRKINWTFNICLVVSTSHMCVCPKSYSYSIKCDLFPIIQPTDI